jgi:hypothetical protein
VTSIRATFSPRETFFEKVTRKLRMAVMIKMTAKKIRTFFNV